VALILVILVVCEVRLRWLAEEDRRYDLASPLPRNGRVRGSFICNPRLSDPGEAEFPSSA
jgi:hypothetical protein